MSFYAYLHCKPDGTPFYVGKGSAYRLTFVKRSHNQWHCNIVKKYGEENILGGSMECSTEESALDLERGLIKRLKVMGVKLTNLTDGGDGTSGYKMPETAKQKISEAKIGNQWNCGRKYSIETRRKKSRSLGGGSVECEKDGVILRFFSISEAAAELGLSYANISHHLARKGERKLRGVKGWLFRRVKDGD